MTPYRKDKFPLKIPVHSNITSTQLASFKPDLSKDFITYTVVQGDSLWSIARRYQTSIQNIYLSNPVLANRRYLKPKQKITIPISKKSYAQAKQDKKTNEKIHIVRRGDSLWSIARKYRTSIKSILHKNYHLKSAKDIIQIGSKINI